MAIVIINGPTQSGKSYIANSLRNNAVNSGKGCLLLDEDQEGELKSLIEKIIDGDRLEFGQKVDKIKWKKDPQIIVVGKGMEVLKQIESVLPGFMGQFEPIYNVKTGG